MTIRLCEMVLPPTQVVTTKNQIQNREQLSDARFMLEFEDANAAKFPLAVSTARGSSIRSARRIAVGFSRRSNFISLN